MKKNDIDRSPLFYVGDKHKLIAEIREYLPKDINRFIEPFVGGGSVFMNVEAKQFLLNDIDCNVIALHRFLCASIDDLCGFWKRIYEIIDHYGLSCSSKKDCIPNELKQQYVKTYFAEYNRAAFLRLRDDYNRSNRNDVAMLYVLLIYGFNRMLRFNRTGNYNLPVGNVDFNLNVVDALNRYFDLVAVKQPQWHNSDFKQFMDGIDWQKNDFVYLDPPYLITFSEYNKLWNEDEERALLMRLDGLNGKGIRFAISNVTHYKGNTNQIFLKWAEQYYCHSIKSNYISYHDNTVKQFNEVLVTNY